MQEITTNKAREKKLQLETYINDAIEDFEDATGCVVVDIKIDRTFLSELDMKKGVVHNTNFNGISMSVEL